ncbi:adenosylcobinamide-phosphate synthase CbiB [uncultured Cohaesibacter sp.]|uniref:adenosylcobinamide-phosphate synthase CbiB n=1 Tax=uncultured Cohaesibacter sp. TaxID=1002546 RepID=UPI002931AF6E|nr:adenosylcobinamide-phosphate synthase CbiB [uncultured Cohaesibacter sp.]
MLIANGILAAVLIAILVDALFGEPAWLWHRVPHPVVLFGKLIDWLDAHFNHFRQQSPSSGRLAGVISLLFLVIGGAVLGWALEAGLLALGIPGLVLIGILSSSLIAQKSLYDHVGAVATPLIVGDREKARQAVSMIVGRDTSKLDDAGIARAAIESLAENFSDGIVAPLFWFVLFGLPGLIVYKIVNTADSMIGHRNEKYTHFGWAAARLDDVLNLAPARITMALLLFTPVSLGRMPSLSAVQWSSLLKDARRHRSPNAGWPEAAIAQRLGIALSGPRYYDGVFVDEAYVNDTGERDIGGYDINASLVLYRNACILEFLVIALIYIAMI